MNRTASPPDDTVDPSELASLRQQVAQLNTLYHLSTLLAAHRDLQQVLDVAARSAAEVMQVKAASIRLLDDRGEELYIKAVHNLSTQYLNKGPVLVKDSDLYRRTIEGNIEYVENMSTDKRILYPQDAKREGLVSVLAAPMIYQGRPTGVIRLYTGTLRRFTELEINLLRAIAQLLAAAIEHARLDAARREHRQIERQLHMAADVQRRMLPSKMPNVPPFDIAARYSPSFELGGDFYDFIPLEDHLGICVGDVVGKGIAAGLLMASVRAALRAYAQDIYDLDEVISRVNVALTRETLDREFATLFYGVIDPATLRMTYCNAGHEPPLLWREGHFSRLKEGGMIVGIDPEQKYVKRIVELQANDILFLYSDGLPDAQNFDQQRFGRQRIEAAIRDMTNGTAHDIVNHALWEMRRYVGLNQQIDDTTIVALKVGLPA